MFKIIESKTTKIAHVTSPETKIHSTQDAVDLMGNANCQGANSIILHQDNLHPDFFDLKTGIAGEILQKYSNYRIKLAIIGDFSRYDSKALQAFITESNRSGPVFFLPDLETAMDRLSAGGAR